MSDNESSLELIRGTLSTASRAQLKRCAGRPMSECSKAFGAYYTAKPHHVQQRQEEKHFTAVTLSCLWKDEERGELLSLPACLRRLRDSDTQAPAQDPQNRSLNSLDRRFMALLDSDWDDEGLFIAKLFRLVQLIRSKASGYSPDFAQLYKDLLHWDSTSLNGEPRWIRRNWARTYFAPEFNTAPVNEQTISKEE